ncbi:fimbrial protein [Pseudomonas chlororaphis]|uniref:fimbrial protein n=1 Tax=Pseudomonas chlororaphis TaxID=587753 RepID=UPI00130E8E1F|nr:fimbrial protein [Pseudomonas chlororaphis]
MNWRYLCAVGMLAFCHNAVAYDLLLNVSGTIAANGCTVSADSQNMTVTFGNVATKQFFANQTPWAKRKFVIQLERCGSAATEVKVSFNGIADSDNSDLLKITQDAGAASGLGIEILDMNGVTIPIGTQMASALPIDATPGGTNQLVFYAQYRSTGPVTVGPANATANFVLEYP